MKSRTKVIIVLAVLLLLILAFFGVRFLRSFQEYRDGVASIAFDRADASGLPDGVYVGAHDVGLVSAKVEVTVQNGAIASIVILDHNHGRGAAAEKIIDEILAQQKIDVDTITGATNSSLVLQKAVDNALSSAQQ
ncbi:MAG: FMN-binding protein [Clostridia bacterium]|nr:FMN-binding protein [Clostridia bacterium]